jgi:hypothetical protein
MGDEPGRAPLDGTPPPGGRLPRPLLDEPNVDEDDDGGFLSPPPKREVNPLSGLLPPPLEGFESGFLSPPPPSLDMNPPSGLLPPPLEGFESGFLSPPPKREVNPPSGLLPPPLEGFESGFLSPLPPKREVNPPSGLLLPPDGFASGFLSPPNDDPLLGGLGLSSSFLASPGRGESWLLPGLVNGDGPLPLLPGVAGRCPPPNSELLLDELLELPGPPERIGLGVEPPCGCVGRDAGNPAPLTRLAPGNDDVEGRLKEVDDERLELSSSSSSSSSS